MIRATTGSRPNESLLGQNRSNTRIVGLRRDPFHYLTLETDTQRFHCWVSPQPPVVKSFPSSEPRSGGVESQARNDYEIR